MPPDSSLRDGVWVHRFERSAQAQLGVTGLGVGLLYVCTVVLRVGWFLMLMPFRVFIALMPRGCWGSS